MKNNKQKKFGFAFLLCIGIVSLLAILATPTKAVADTTRPTIISTTTVNNALDVSTDQIIKITFSEPMDPNTINSDTFILIQQTTPETGSTAASFRSRQLEGMISYNGDTATFTPLRNQQNPLQPSQEFGNVFTATITTGATDLAGNSLAQDYKWSFTTGLNDFNTGMATAQLSQQENPSSPEAVNPGATTENVVNSQTSTSPNGFNWGWSTWILGGALLVLIGLVIAIIVGASSSTKKKMVIKNTAKNDDTFGEVYPVKNIEGIGAVYSAALNKIGIMNTEQLWKANAVKTAHAIDAPLSSVKSWQNMAELTSVKDIGPQYAELLERSGIHSLEQLRNSDSKTVLEAINKKQESLEVNIQGNSPGIVTVENWIEQAKSHTMTQNEAGTA